MFTPALTVETISRAFDAPALSTRRPPFAAPEPLTFELVGADGTVGRLRIDPSPTHPALRPSTDVFHGPHTVLFGMSPGNGYFTKRRVEIAVAAFARLSGNVAVIVPDSIAIHTYRALGHPEGEARARTKKHGAHMKNRAARAITEAGALNPGATLRHLDWDRNVATLPRFADSLANLERLLETHPRFRSDVLGCARGVLEGKTDGGRATDAAAREAATYLLSELAFIRACAALLGPRVLVPYHKPFVLLADFCAGAYGAPVPGVTSMVYDIEVVGERAAVAGDCHAG